MMLQLPRLSALLPLSLLALAACSSGGDGGSSEPTGSADLVLTTTSMPELFALEAAVSSVRLIRFDGEVGPNLLGGDASAELTSLEDVSLWLSASNVAPGAYKAVRVAFAPQFAAKKVGGGDQDVEAGGLELEAPLSEPLVVSPDGYARAEVYIDLSSSLTSSTITPETMTFDPEGAFRELDPTEAPDLAPFFGIVTGASPAEDSFEVEVYRDHALTEPLRTVDVTLDAGALLVDLNDVVFPGVQDFFAALVLDKTVVEVTGELAGTGAVLASKVEILSQDGKPSGTVVITGEVLNVDGPGQQFVLLIQHVDAGADVAATVLESIGDPSAIDVTWDASTAFFGASGKLAGDADLSEGQLVRVEFADFSWPPFPAAKVELLGLDLNGTIDDVTNLPDSFVLKVGGGDLVTVHLSEQTELRLDTQFKPHLTTDEIVVGMKAAVKGGLHVDPPAAGEGDPVADGVDADAIRIHHGYLIQADVVAADALISTVWTDGGMHPQTFGVLAPEGPLKIVIDDDCLFGQDADNESQLFLLLDSGADVELKVKGVGSSEPGEIHAYDVKAKAK